MISVTDSESTIVLDSSSVVVIDDSPALNQWEKNFLSLHRVQTKTREVDIRVTITGYCVDAPALLSEVSQDHIFIDGGTAENGGWTVTMLLRDLSSMPPENTAVQVNGDAADVPLRIMGDAKKTNNATATFIAGDFSAKN